MWLEENETPFSGRIFNRRGLNFLQFPLRLFDSFHINVLFNLLLTFLFERQNRKTEKRLFFLNMKKNYYYYHCYYY